MIGFQPVVSQQGYAGWRFLERTIEPQKAAFEKSPEVLRDLEYFKQNIHNATSAEDLVNDRRLLKVALGAFGLEDDIDKRAYVLKALGEGTDDEKSFANRMVDSRYREFSKAFGYGNLLGAQVERTGFAERIMTQFKSHQFEVAVGEGNQSMRLALTFVREIADLANSEKADTSAWFEVMGNPPMRQIFEASFGLPKSFGSMDVDKQREILREKNDKMFGDGSLSVFRDPANVDKMLKMFFLRQQLSENSGMNAPGFAALTLLKSSANGMAQFFQSRL